MQIVNISAYKFVTLEDRETLRPALLAECQARELKGTVLLAPEGINIFLAGTREAIDGIVGWLRADPRFADLNPKESLSDHQPFRRLLVRLKKEIITMRHPLIRPEDGRAPSVSPADLKRWLDQGHDDEGRPVVMLDTRNGFEVAVGTFRNAVDYGITKFTEFPPGHCRPQGRLRRQDRRVVLHRRHPLRKGGDPHAEDRRRTGVPARRRHPEVLRRSRRRAL